MLRQARSCACEEFFGVAEFLHVVQPHAEEDGDQRGGDDAQRQQPLKDAGPLAARGRAQAFRQIQRNDDADQARR